MEQQLVQCGRRKEGRSWLGPAGAEGTLFPNKYVALWDQKMFSPFKREIMAALKCLRVRKL